MNMTLATLNFQARIKDFSKGFPQKKGGSRLFSEYCF